jgi:hypothetical protein
MTPAKEASWMMPLFFGARPMPVALLMTERVLTILCDAGSTGCYVEHDKSAGTAKAYDDENLVFQAIQKGRGGPWICRFVQTEQITWNGAMAG